MNKKGVKYISITPFIMFKARRGGNSKHIRGDSSYGQKSRN